MLGLEKDSQNRFRTFIKQVSESGEVWGLESEEGWCQSPSNEEEGRVVMPFWSHRALAARCALNEWADFAPSAIPLSEFLEAWLPGMAEDRVRVGVNWNAQLVGAEVEPGDLLGYLSGSTRSV